MLIRLNHCDIIFLCYQSVELLFTHDFQYFIISNNNKNNKYKLISNSYDIYIEQIFYFDEILFDLFFVDGQKFILRGKRGRSVR